MKIRDLGRVYNEEIDEAFDGTDFGEIDRRKYLAASILEIQAGYHTGYTITCILQEIGLLSQKKRVTKRGRAFLWFEYSKALPKWKR
jgi:hypothetical protein